MSTDVRKKADWDPTSEEVLHDQCAAYDAMRERCPVAYSERMHWSLFRHDDVVRVLHDHDTFSNAVSAYLSVPHGMDPPLHGAYRRIIDPYFAPARVAAFEPACRQIAIELVHDALGRTEVEVMSELALPFAVRAQCAFLGWPPLPHQMLARWIRRKHEATLAQDRQILAEVAREFDDLIEAQLDARVRACAAAGDDATASLMHEQIDGRPLTRQEIASILRNWTAGEVGTIAAASGILAHYFATHDEWRLRVRTAPALLPQVIDEILRIHGPLVANRRVATRSVQIGGRTIEAGERLSLIWASANRDDRVFAQPDEVRLDRDANKNLLYGAGIHVCPGAPVARMELRVLMEELLARAARLAPAAGKPPVNARYPAGGFSTLPLVIARADMAADRMSTR